MRGSTGAVLKRSLVGLRDLINRSVTEVRLRQVMQDRVHIDVAELIEELAPAAALEAAGRGLQFTVQSGEAGVAVYADRHVLSAVVMNLLQNAFKFTRVRTSVGLSVRANADRVLIEIADQCGGLADGNVQELFRPFEQRNADRTGLGLGLAFSHWGVEANDGKISVRNLAGPRLRVHRRSAEGSHAGHGDGLSASRPFRAAPLQRNRASPGDFSAKSTGAVCKEKQPDVGPPDCPGQRPVAEVRARPRRHG